MHTVSASPAPFTIELRTPTTIDRPCAADEPSHIHIPRPRPVMHSAGGATHLAETGRRPRG